MAQIHPDIVTLLKGQHQQIRLLLGQVVSACGVGRQNAFTAFRRALIVHEMTEADIVHPSARRVLPSGEGVALARLREEIHVRRLLAKLERINVNAPAFDRELRALEASLFAHVDAEEAVELPELAKMLDATQLERMMKAAEYSEAATYPSASRNLERVPWHPNPLAIVAERVRDMLSGKS